MSSYQDTLEPVSIKFWSKMNLIENSSPEVDQNEFLAFVVKMTEGFENFAKLQRCVAMVRFYNIIDFIF